MSEEKPYGVDVGLNIGDNGEITTKHITMPSERCSSNWYATTNPEAMIRSAKMVLTSTGKAQAVHKHIFGKPCKRGECFVLSFEEKR